MFLKLIQAIIPEPIVLRQPIPQRAKLFGDELIVSFTTMPLFGQETRIQQDAQMLRNRRAAHVEVGRKPANRTVTLGKQIQHLAPPTVTDRLEHIGLAVGGSIHVFIMGKKLLTCQTLTFEME